MKFNISLPLVIVILFVGTAAAAKVCPNCNQVWADDYIFCMSCGVSLVEASKPPPEDVKISPGVECPACEALVKSGALFCYKCGYRFGQTKKCSSCDLELPSDAAFCDVCGAPAVTANYLYKNLFASGSLAGLELLGDGVYSLEGGTLTLGDGNGTSVKKMRCGIRIKTAGKNIKASGKFRVVQRFSRSFWGNTGGAVKIYVLASHTGGYGLYFGGSFVEWILWEKGDVLNAPFLCELEKDGITARAHKGFDLANVDVHSFFAEVNGNKAKFVLDGLKFEDDYTTLKWPHHAHGRYRKKYGATYSLDPGDFMIAVYDDAIIEILELYVEEQ
jgi:RNA polymerase subunit RPABC4/transcription elongation factor Spt4